MMPANQTSAKAAIRASMLSRRAALGLQENRRMSAALVSQLVARQAWKTADWVGLFASLPEEVQLEGVMAPIAEAGRNMLFPAYDPDRRIYRYREWKAGGPWTRGRWNIPEPAGTGFAELTGRAVLLVPGLAFDRCGRRIGYGAGFYDRMLEMAHQTCDAVVSIGVCFPFQVLEDEELPEESYDQRVQFLATGKAWLVSRNT